MDIEETCIEAREMSRRAIADTIACRSELSAVSNRVAVLADQFDESRVIRERLGRRVTDVERRIDDHEDDSKAAVEELRHLRETIKETLSVPRPVPSGSAVVMAWKETPLKTKAGITGTIIALLMAHDGLKLVGGWLVDFVRLIAAHWH